MGHIPVGPVPKWHWLAWPNLNKSELVVALAAAGQGGNSALLRVIKLLLEGGSERSLQVAGPKWGRLAL